MRQSDTYRLRLRITGTDAPTVTADQITVAVGDGPFHPVATYTPGAVGVAVAYVGAKAATGPLPLGTPALRVHFEIPPQSYTVTVADVLYVEA